jgi:hypothetical protein
MNTPDIIAILTSLQENGVAFVFRILLLFALFVFILFAFILANRIRALNRTLFLAANGASATLQIVTVIILLVAVSLFVATIVIV